MECYFPLASHFHMQSEPAYCGLGTLAMSLNALSVDPLRQWKGVWRFYDESMLDCCKSLSVVQKEGITIPEYVCLARCNGALAQLYYGEESSVDRFRAMLLECTKHADQILTCSYSRRVLGQTGDGHFSPIGGYDPTTDHCLIMDVARFKYPPHWVPVPLLFDAMLPNDRATSRSRGYIVLTRGHSSVLGRLISSPLEWRQLSAAFLVDLTTFLRSSSGGSGSDNGSDSGGRGPGGGNDARSGHQREEEEGADGEEEGEEQNNREATVATTLVPRLATFLCAHPLFGMFETHSSEALSRLSPLHRQSFAELAKQAATTHLHSLLACTSLSADHCIKAVVFILALRARLSEELPAISAAQWETVLQVGENPLLLAEVETIRDSLRQMDRFCLRCSSGAQS
jgi:Phytochelatin synthase